MSIKTLTRQEAAQLLGVSMTATPLQIRKAFRRLAKSVHPDVNPSVQSKEQFILLQEAQRVLLAPRTYDKFAPPKQNYDGWMHRSQQVARDFSQRYVDPDDVKVQEAIEPFFLGLLRLLAFLVLGTSAFLIYNSFSLFNAAGVIINGVAILLIFLSRKLTWQRFFSAARILLINPVFLIIFFFIANLIFFWGIGMRTFIPLPIQTGIIFGSPFLFLFTQYFLDKLQSLTAAKFMLSLFVGFAFNLLLLFNFLTAKPYFEGLWSWRYQQLVSKQHWTIASKNSIINTRFKTKIESYSKLRSYDMPVVLKKGLFVDCMEY